MSSIHEALDLSPVQATALDQALAEAGDALVLLYLWGEDCFNCEMFKKAALQKVDAWRALQLHGLHSNVYADTAMGLRFSLHGVPAFFFFHRGRKLGRITGWPGWAEFEKAVQSLQHQIQTPIALETRALIHR